jgi:hypothetical protein
MNLSRRTLPSLVALLILAACSSTPPRSYEPLSYDYLPQLRLNVASVDIEDRTAPTSAGDVSSQAPIPPIVALRQMANDRLKAFGNSGRAVLVIRQLSLVRSGDRIAGRMNVQLDIYTSDNQRAAFATAEVTQSRTGDVDDLRATLYDITKLMMDKMNVELEFQARRSLKDWLLKVPSVTPAPVTQENLAAPGK